MAGRGYMAVSAEGPMQGGPRGSRLNSRSADFLPFPRWWILRGFRKQKHDFHTQEGGWGEAYRAGVAESFCHGGSMDEATLDRGAFRDKRGRGVHHFLPFPRDPSDGRENAGGQAKKSSAKQDLTGIARWPDHSPTESLAP